MRSACVLRRLNLEISFDLAQSKKKVFPNKQIRNERWFNF